MRVFWRQIKLIHRVFSKAHIKITPHVRIWGVSLLKPERMAVKSLQARGLGHPKALLADFGLKFCDCKNIFIHESHYMWAPVMTVQQELFCKIAVFYCLGGFDLFRPLFWVFLRWLIIAAGRELQPPASVSLFLDCDPRHDSLWAFLFSNGRKEVFVNRELSVLLLMTTTGADWVGVQDCWAA